MTTTNHNIISLGGSDFLKTNTITSFYEYINYDNSSSTYMKLTLSGSASRSYITSLTYSATSNFSSSITMYTSAAAGSGLDFYWDANENGFPGLLNITLELGWFYFTFSDGTRSYFKLYSGYFDNVSTGYGGYWPDVIGYSGQLDSVWQSVDLELDVSSSTQISMNDGNVRSLSATSSGSQLSLSGLKDKTAVFNVVSSYVNYGDTTVRELTTHSIDVGIANNMNFIYHADGIFAGGSGTSKLVGMNPLGVIKWNNHTGSGGLVRSAVKIDNAGVIFNLCYDRSTNHPVITKAYAANGYDYACWEITDPTASRSYGGTLSSFYVQGDYVYLAFASMITSTYMVEVNLIKMNKSGTIQWQKKIQLGNQSMPVYYGQTLPPQPDVYSISVTVDSSDYVYFTYTYGAWIDQIMDSYWYGYYLYITNTQITTIKLNSSGTEQWRKSYRAGSDGRTLYSAPYPNIRDSITDSSNNLYTAGTYTTYDAYWNYSSSTLAKHNSSGTLQWWSHAAYDFYDAGYQIDVDSSGNIYFTTTSYDYWGSGSIITYLYKFNSSGTLQWQRKFYSTASSLTVFYITSLKIKGNYMYLSGSLQATIGGYIYISSVVMVLPTDGSKTGTYTVAAKRTDNSSLTTISIDYSTPSSPTIYSSVPTFSTYEPGFSFSSAAYSTAYYYPYNSDSISIPNTTQVVKL